MSYYTPDQLTKMRIDELRLQNRLNESGGDKIAAIYEYEEKVKQQTNAMVTTDNIPSYENLYISRKTERDQRFESNGNLVQLLLQIADQENAEKIFNLLQGELTDTQLKTLMENWPKLLTLIRKTFSRGVSTRTLVDFLVREVKDITPVPPNSPRSTKRNVIGKRKADNAASYDTDQLPISTWLYPSSQPEKIKKQRGRPRKNNNNDDDDDIYSPPSSAEGKPMHDETTNESIGTGLKKKNIRFVMRGTGSGEAEEEVEVKRVPKMSTTKNRYAKLNKFVINYDDLNKGILNLKYEKSMVRHPRMYKQKISSELQDILLDIVEYSTFEKSKFRRMTEPDKSLLRVFCDICHININEFSFDDIQKQYEILIGQRASGNNSPVLARQLIRLITEGIVEKRIPMKQGLEIINKI